MHMRSLVDSVKLGDEDRPLPLKRKRKEEKEQEHIMSLFSLAAILYACVCVSTNKTCTNVGVAQEG